MTMIERAGEVAVEVRNVPQMRKFSYDAPQHENLPHVVKFSGGRTSGMLLCMLLDNGLLRAERGDVVVFNNTSAEHPETYRFAARCKELVERRYGVPFFWVEFQTYEDARRGEWTRLPTYRLVEPAPRSEERPNGYCWKGEAFEEMLSWAGYVPNGHQRICTKNLKLETTRLFLRDWFSGKDGNRRLGHYGDGSRLDDDDLYERHRRRRGAMPRDIFLQKKAYMRSRPVFRPEQAFSKYSSVVPVNRPAVFRKRAGGKDTDYLSFVGLRADELRRVARVRQRNFEDTDPAASGNEYAYMPLATLGLVREDVDVFWSEQSWGLNLPDDTGLSNCAYCFLKGAGGLQKAHNELKGKGVLPADLALRNTPCDIRWWRQMESQYGRNLVLEEREVRNKSREGFIGFFGMNSGFSYELVAEFSKGRADISGHMDTVLPCDCTE